MTITLKDLYCEFLTTPTAAVELASTIAQKWSEEDIVLDFAGVLQMTPSFVNTLVFNLMHADPAAMDGRVKIQNADSYIVEAIQKAITRKRSGVELTHYAIGPQQELPQP